MRISMDMEIDNTEGRKEIMTFLLTSILVVKSEQAEPQVPSVTTMILSSFSER